MKNCLRLILFESFNPRHPPTLFSNKIQFYKSFSESQTGYVQKIRLKVILEIFLTFSHLAQVQVEILHTCEVKAHGGSKKYNLECL